jgi:hypothetical protein
MRARKDLLGAFRGRVEHEARQRLTRQLRRVPIRCSRSGSARSSMRSVLATSGHLLYGTCTATVRRGQAAAGQLASGIADSGTR